MLAAVRLRFSNPFLRRAPALQTLLTFAGCVAFAPTVRAVASLTPTVTTATATGIGSASATLGGSVTADGGATVTESGVVYSTSNNTPTTSDTKVAMGSGLGAFSQSVTGLTSATTYYVRAFATNSAGTAYGSVGTFTTLSTNANLSALALSSGTLSPSFASATTSYTASVTGSVTSVTLTPTVAQANATVTVNGASVTSGSASSAISLSLGENSISVVVTAQDGTTTKTYTVVVTRTNTAPSATTSPASAVTSTGATLKGAVDDNGLSTSVSFEYGLTTAYGSTASATPATVSSGSTNVSATLTGLSPNTTYHYRVVATSSLGTTYGNDVAFTTSASIFDSYPSGTNLSFATAPRTFIGAGINLGDLGGTSNITISGGTAFVGSVVAANYTNVRLTVTFWGTVSGATSGTTPAFSNQLGTESFDFGPLAAEAAKAYVYRFALTTPVVASAQTIGVTLHWQVDTGSGLASTDNFTPVIRSGAVPVAVGSPAVGTAGTWGYYRNASGETNGNFLGSSFRFLNGGAVNQTLALILYTSPAPPLARTIAATSVTSTGATLNAKVNPASLATTAFFEYGTTTSYGSTASITLTPNNGASTQDVSAIITGLTGGTTYHFRVSGTNSYGAANGDDLTFTTSSSTAPVIGSPTSASIGSSTATLGGDVTSDGGASITERGSVYALTSANANPLIDGTGVTKVTASGTTGIFTANVTGLTPSSSYTFKAYATNSVGTTYTSVGTFTTLSNNANLAGLAISTGTLTPTFASGTTSYAVSVGNSTTSLTVTPTVAQGNATVKVNGATTTSGSASSAIALNVGDNTITILVTAEDSTTTKSYTVTVTRAAPDTTPPTIVSIVRLTPSAQTIGDGTTSFTFRVTYSEAVQGVTTAQFSVEAVNGSSISGSVASVSGSGTTRDVTVNITGGAGEFRLKAVD